VTKGADSNTAADNIGINRYMAPIKPATRSRFKRQKRRPHSRSWIILELHVLALLDVEVGPSSVVVAREVPKHNVVLAALSNE